MASIRSILALFTIFFSTAWAAVIAERAANPYAPVTASCPSTPLVRAASGLSSSESAYVAARKVKADASLAAWLKKTNSGFSTSSLPAVGLSVSGGGYRALLVGAGVIQGFDARDSAVSTSGLFQGLTYHAGLSGGSWLLSSLAGNNWPTISSLRTGVWESSFKNGPLLPGGLLTPINDVKISADISAKRAAGFVPSITDPWGRLLSYQLLYGSDGGVADRLSGLTSLSNFVSNSVPYPIITSVGVPSGQCLPGANATQYEFTPYEFGSWDTGVSAFTQTAYLGSKLSGGKPTGSCIQNYDNLGYVLGTSSDLFSGVCEESDPLNELVVIVNALKKLVDSSGQPESRFLDSPYVNPFYKYSGSPLVSSQTELDLADGGESNQNDPIWPFIQPARNVPVLIVVDASSDQNNEPDGSALYNTYTRAQAAGLTKMPKVPTSAQFLAQGLNTRATFFGCNDKSVITLIVLPNYPYTYASNVDTFKITYSKADTDGIIADGVSVATQNGDAGWATCLGCAITQKQGGSLPSACAACFTKYCYTG